MGSKDRRKTYRVAPDMVRVGLNSNELPAVAVEPWSPLGSKVKVEKPVVNDVTVVRDPLGPIPTELKTVFVCVMTSVPKTIPAKLATMKQPPQSIEVDAVTSDAADGSDMGAVIFLSL